MRGSGQIKTQFTLLQLEYEWRAVRIYRKIVNWLVKKRINLSSPLLCMVKGKMDKHYFILYDAQKFYELRTGQTIRYYKFDEI